ncbi:MAG: hypothetical protein WCJ02_04815 [bacterium]
MKKKLVGWLLTLGGIGICLLSLAYAALFLFLLIFQDARLLPVLVLITAGGIYYLLACTGIAVWASIPTKIILLLESVAIIVAVFASSNYSLLLVPGSLAFSGLGVLLFRSGRRIIIR